MRGVIARYVAERARSSGEAIPVGYNWVFVISSDAMVVGLGIIAVLQRPSTDLPIARLALAIATVPVVHVFLFSPVHKTPVVWTAGTAATMLLLFATSTPIATDFAPLLLAMTVGEIASTTRVLIAFLCTVSSVAVLVVAQTMHRLDAVTLYLGILGMAWLVGYLMRVQQQLMEEQLQAQAALATHAAADERRRIAREVHDVIAHSLSITLLHITGARRGLQEDRDVDDAVDALEQAERLGRQAMADIRRTVGLLDSAPMAISPEPGVDDIPALVDDFVRAGLAVTLNANGCTDGVSAAVGLALYRIAQESLTNVAKHSPDANSTVMLAISRTSATLNVVNRLPADAVVAPATEGRGVRGMRQRVGQLGGIISIGPTADGWSVQTNIPLNHDDHRCTWPS